MAATRLVPMIAVSNIEQALKLYEGILGFRVTERCVEDGSLIWCWAKAGESDVMFQRHPRQAAKNGGVVFWVYCDNVDALRETVAANGYKVGLADSANGRRECECWDADGNDIMLCQVLDR